MTASEILSKLIKLQQDGSLIDYKGRNILSNVQIQSISTSHPNTNAGGADFDMTLKQVRIAKSAYQASTNTTANKKNNPDLSVGSIVVFTGGSVYVSSDAKKATVNRGRSTCKITIINTRSWAKHPYHLISTDGKMVYGWVDKENIEGVTSNGTAPTTNGGTQQVQKGSDETVVHLVKKGDTVYDLVNTTYKDYNLSCAAVIKANPSAFSIAGNARTLQIGTQLMIYDG